MRRVLPALAVISLAHAANAQQPPQRALMPIPFANSADARWLKKPVLARRVLDDMRDSSTWRMTGTGKLSFSARKDTMRALRVDMDMFTGPPAPTRNKLSSVNLRRAIPNEDWSAYNRLSLWLRADV